MNMMVRSHLLNTQESVMGRRFIDKTGMRFGRLTVKELLSKNPSSRWVCVCDCGKETKVYGGHLSGGTVKSCGCLLADLNKIQKTTHGMTKTKTYSSWRSMIRRCSVKSSYNYARYGGAGIVFDLAWKDFNKFFSDMGERPDGTSLDRIDTNKGYSKDNCRWETSQQQQSNRNCCMNLTYNGVTKTSAEWSTELKLSKSAVWNRIKLGWPVEKAVTTRKAG